MRVDELPLPRPAIELLKQRGIETLFPPQEQAVKAGLLDGKSLVVSIPTAAGKTLIAELAMLKCVLEGRGKALYMVPLKALANEKYDEFKSYEKLGIKVAISTGDYDSSDPWLAEYDVIVSTNEKVDSLLRHRAPWIKDVAVIVADEVHLLSYRDRGPTLEVVLTHFRTLRPDAQIIALSATIRNADELAEWLGAELVKSEWRPVPLREGVYFDGVIKYADGDEAHVAKRTGDPVVDLVLDIVDKGGQALVFANTRHSAVAIARKLRAHILKLLTPAERRQLRQLADELREAGERTQLSEELANDVAAGVAFHHAGLSHQHRRLVERYFRELQLKAVVATPTLAAGVNLPARRVIISSYWRYEPGEGVVPIPVLEYKQMAGRAGRPRFDEYGEAILIARSADEVDHLMKTYIEAEPERIWSKLGAEPALRSHILALIAGGIAKDERSLLSFIEKTFYAFQQGGVAGIRNVVRGILAFLYKHGFVEPGPPLRATFFGRRVAELYIDPLSAVRIREALKNVPITKVTPLSLLHMICSTPDMPKIYLRRGERRSVEGFAEAHYEEFLVPPPDEEYDPVGYETFLTEVKTAMLLYDWIEESSEDYIVRQYDVGPGDIYNLIQTAEWLLYAAREIASLLGMREIAEKLERLRERVKYGVKEELLELVRLRGIGRTKARILYQAGYRTLEDLAKASPAELLRLPLIGPETVKAIKEQLGQPITVPERRRPRTLLDWIEPTGRGKRK